MKEQASDAAELEAVARSRSAAVAVHPSYRHDLTDYIITASTPVKAALTFDSVDGTNALPAYLDLPKF